MPTVALWSPASRAQATDRVRQRQRGARCHDKLDGGVRVRGCAGGCTWRAGAGAWSEPLLSCSVWSSYFATRNWVAAVEVHARVRLNKERVLMLPDACVRCMRVLADSGCVHAGG